MFSWQAAHPRLSVLWIYKGAVILPEMGDHYFVLPGGFLLFTLYIYCIHGFAEYLRNYFEFEENLFFLSVIYIYR